MNTRFWRYAVCLLGMLSVALLALLARAVIKLQQVRAEVRLTRDLIWRYDAEREHALKGDVRQAVQYLQMFNVPSSPDELGNKNLAYILGRERKQAVREIITYLRTKTGKNFGDEPEKWIEGLKDDAGEVKAQ